MRGFDDKLHRARVEAAQLMAEVHYGFADRMDATAVFFRQAQTRDLARRLALKSKAAGIVDHDRVLAGEIKGRVRKPAQ